MGDGWNQTPHPKGNNSPFSSSFFWTLAQGDKCGSASLREHGTWFLLKQSHREAYSQKQASNPAATSAVCVPTKVSRMCLSNAIGLRHPRLAVFEVDPQCANGPSDLVGVVAEARCGIKRAARRAQRVWRWVNLPERPDWPNAPWGGHPMRSKKSVRLWRRNGSGAEAATILTPACFEAILTSIAFDTTLP